MKETWNVLERVSRVVADGYDRENVKETWHPNGKRLRKGGPHERIQQTSAIHYGNL